jgi:hypothetical protein
MSTYTWAQYGADGKLSVTGVPRGTMLDLEQKVTANWPTYYLQYFKAKADNYALWRRVAITAKSRIEDRVAKAAIDESLKQVEASRKRVADLQKTLEDALEKERHGAEGVIILKALQGVLTVAQLASKAAEYLGVSSAEFDGASTGAAVFKRIDTIQEGRHKTVIAIQAEFDGSVEGLQKFLDQLWNQIQRAGPPPEVRNDFEIKKP